MPAHARLGKMFSMLTGDLRAARVLVVDDHVDTADVMQMFLAHAGYTARAAYSGGEALALERQYAPDLAILDIRLPDMDGYELARRLRAAAGARSLWLIGLSGYAAPNHALAACFDEMARKPIRGDDLLGIMRRFGPRRAPRPRGAIWSV